MGTSLCRSSKRNDTDLVFIFSGFNFVSVLLLFCLMTMVLLSFCSLFSLTLMTMAPTMRCLALLQVSVFSVLLGCRFGIVSQFLPMAVEVEVGILLLPFFLFSQFHFVQLRLQSVVALGVGIPTVLLFFSWLCALPSVLLSSRVRAVPSPF